MSIRFCLILFAVFFMSTLRADTTITGGNTQPNNSGTGSNMPWKPMAKGCKLVNASSITDAELFTQANEDPNYRATTKFPKNEVFPPNGISEETRTKVINLQESYIGGQHWYSFRMPPDTHTYFLPASAMIRTSGDCPKYVNN